MDENKDLKQDLEQKPPAKWATPVQRVWAWVGVVYMIILVLLSTFALAHGDYLRGIGGLMLSPTVILRYRQGAGQGGLPVCILLSGVSFALAVWNMVRDLPILLSQL